MFCRCPHAFSCHFNIFYVVVIKEMCVCVCGCVYMCVYSIYGIKNTVFLYVVCAGVFVPSDSLSPLCHHVLIYVYSRNTEIYFFKGLPPLKQQSIV